MLSRIPYWCCRETAIQSMQYKIINNYFPCGNMLHKWKINYTDICSYCNEEDTIEHYFIECRVVKQLWNDIKLFLKQVSTVNLSFGNLDVLLGIPLDKNSKELKLQIFIILYTKFYIFNSKKKLKPNIIP